jgi:hypothetical protein
LKAGLFASVADKDMPCRVDGCGNTWPWSGVDQMKNLGQPPPQRMCDEHLADFNALADQEVPCRNPGCSNTWTWKRGAQLYLLQKTEKLKPPSRLCSDCFGQEKSLADVEIGCRVSSCDRTWTWTRDAQVKHRAWVRRLQAKIQSEEEAEARPEREAKEIPAQASAEPAPDGAAEQKTAEGEASEGEALPTEAKPPEAPAVPQKKKRRNRKKKRRKVPEGPPEKMCQICAAKFSRLEPIELPCKVHGCTRTATWSRDAQLRAWSAMHTEDIEVQPTPPKRMCNICRDFCRLESDKQVPCGRPGCENTWTWKTGAQLQAQLAEKKHDPIRLCDSCAKGEFLVAGAAGGQLVAGAEVMPCVVTGCEGAWTYLPGMELSPSREGEEPPDRMCDKCRVERELAPRGPALGQVVPPREPPVEGESGQDAPVAAEEGSLAGEAEESASDTPVVEAKVEGAQESAEPETASTEAPVESSEGSSSKPEAESPEPEPSND